MPTTETHLHKSPLPTIPFTATVTQLLFFVAQNQALPWSLKPKQKLFDFQVPFGYCKLFLSSLPCYKGRCPYRHECPWCPDSHAAAHCYRPVYCRKKMPPHPTKYPANHRPHHRLPFFPIMITEPSLPPPPSQILVTLWWHIAACVWIHLMTWCRLAYLRPDPNHKIHYLKPYNFSPNHTIFWSNHTISLQTIQLSF